MSDTLAIIIIILYFAIGLVVISALEKIFNNEFNGWSIFCIFVWPLVLGLTMIFSIVNLLYAFGEWIGEKLNSLL